MKAGLEKLEEIHEDIFVKMAESHSFSAASTDEDINTWIKGVDDALEQVEVGIDAAKAAKKKHVSYLSSFA